jgi:hypothetical protein
MKGDLHDALFHKRFFIGALQRRSDRIAHMLVADLGGSLPTLYSQI